MSNACGPRNLAWLRRQCASEKPCVQRLDLVEKKVLKSKPLDFVQVSAARAAGGGVFLRLVFDLAKASGISTIPEDDDASFNGRFQGVAGRRLLQGLKTPSAVMPDAESPTGSCCAAQRGAGKFSAVGVLR